MRKKPRVKTMAEMTEREMRNFINSRKRPDKQFFLDLLDEEKQRAYEELHVRVVMTLLKAGTINKPCVRKNFPRKITVRSLR